ncbi:TPA: hypothetical protein ACP5VL_004467, partial [Vibrio parahaemolyticus]
SNVLLTDSYGSSIIKAALKSGDLTFSNPDSQYEKQQIEAVKQQINKCRLESDALLYSLLFNSVILDANTFGGGYIFDNSEDPENIEMKPMFQGLSEGFSSLFKVTNPISEAFSYSNGKMHHDVNLASDEADRIALYQLLEPYVWNRVRKLGSDKINRNVMNEILTILSRSPEVLASVKNRALSSDKDYDFFDNKFVAFWDFYSRSREHVQYFHQMIGLLDTKASVAVARVQEAQRLEAALPIKNITNRQSDLSRLKGLKGENGEFLVSVKVVLNEFKYFPVLNSITDVLKLKDDPGFKEFRIFVNKWVSAVSTGDHATEVLLRKEIEKANKSISKAHTCQKIGRIATYMGLPISIIDLMLGSPVGISLAGGGFLAQGYADRAMSKERWLLIGQEK